MAYEYNVPGLKFGDAVKVFSDEVFRRQQIQAKQQEAMDRAVDNQYKLYSGKLRKNDAAKFDSYFAEYEQAQKQYQRMNKFGGRADEIRKASELASEKKQAMMDFVGRSTAYGAYQTGLSKLYKDPTKLLNRTKFNETYSNLDMYDADELDTRFGGLDKLPKDYEIKPEDVDMNAWLDVANKVTKFRNISSGSVKRPKIDPATGQQITRPFSIEGYGTFQMPVIEYKISLTPEESYNAAMLASVPGTKNAEVPTLAKKQLDDDLRSDNPTVAAAAQNRLKATMDMYNIKDPSQVTGVYLLAQDINSKSESTLELDDWSTFENIQQQIGREQGKIMDKTKMKLLEKKIEQAGNDTAIKNAQKIASFLNSAMTSGILFEEKGLKWANEVIQTLNPGWALSQDMINRMKAGKIFSAEEVASMVLKIKRNTPVPNPQEQ